MVARAKKVDKYLGRGLYSIPEAALYARVTPAMMARWVFGNRKGNAVIQAEFGNSDKVITFLDLVQTLAIREIRLQRRVPLPKFREAIKTARDRLQLNYPFARRHCTYLLGEELVIRPDPDKSDFVEASGKHKGQWLIPFVEMYLKDLSFSPDGLANKYQIFRSRDEVTITMNPQQRFGEPLLPSGYTPMRIFDAIRAEGGIEQAASAYGVPREEVQAAYDFFDHLNKTAA